MTDFLNPFQPNNPNVNKSFQPSANAKAKPEANNPTPAQSQPAPQAANTPVEPNSVYKFMMNQAAMATVGQLQYDRMKRILSQFPSQKDFLRQLKKIKAALHQEFGDSRLSDEEATALASEVWLEMHAPVHMAS